MKTLFAIVFLLHTLSTAFAAEFNKSYPTLSIMYKKFKENEVFEVEDYGKDIYIEASSGFIQQNTFANIPRILRFMVYNSNFSSFDITSLYRMTYLESIDLMDVAGLPVLSNSVMLGFKRLKRLSMYHTDVKFDHNTFQNLEPLEYLSISKVDVAILGNEVFTGSRLKELYWTDSGIEKIDKHCFSPLNQIEIINLSGNKIEILLPETFVGLKHLERVYLNKNKLVVINLRHFEYLPSLQYLDLSRNNIGGIKIEEVWQRMPNLTTIVLDRKSVTPGQKFDEQRGLSVVIV